MSIGKSSLQSRKGGTPAADMRLMQACSWRLPSGEELVEFVLQAGFLAPLLMRTGVGLAPAGRRNGREAGNVSLRECR